MVNLLTKLTTNGNIDMLRLDAVTFRTVMNENIVLITAAFQVVGKNTIFNINNYFQQYYMNYEKQNFKISESDGHSRI